jgi:predicted  nucleic acid-binding Zn-ribbon protein
MPYKCVHCLETYKDDSQEVLIGCLVCRSKFFFYISQERLDAINSNKEKLPTFSDDEKIKMEEDLREIVGEQEKTVFLDFESIKVIKPGKYLLDLNNLFAKGKPKIYQMEDGKYIVDMGKTDFVKQ